MAQATAVAKVLEYTLAQAAEVWGVSYETARRWVVKNKRIPWRRQRHREGVRYLVRHGDVLRVKRELAEEGRYQDGYTAEEVGGGEG